MTDPRVTLQEVMGYSVVPLSESCFLGLTQKHSHCDSEPLPFLLSEKNTLELYFFSYT